MQQIYTHIREAVTETRANDDDDDVDAVEVPDDLLLQRKPHRHQQPPQPGESDMVLLLATVVVQARPMHLMATLNYADLFAWSVPVDMM